VIDDKAPGLDQEPNQERVTAIDLEETVDIGLPRRHHARMVDDHIERKPRRPADKAFDFCLIQNCPPGAQLRKAAPTSARLDGIKLTQSFPTGLPASEYPALRF